MNKSDGFHTGVPKELSKEVSALWIAVQILERICVFEARTGLLMV